MRRDEGKSKKEKEEREEPGWSSPGPSSFLPFTFLLFTCSAPSSLLRSEVHHCVNTIAASGMPSRNPRCGTSRLVTELPQRQPCATSGRIVYECERCRSTPKTPPSL